ncbi:DinB family protein [Robertkochia flava]|uniref:DinB family protein n=1 Tax=Robertkochia flava TaxID=3447986 RepID=UPI001CCEF810|nr:DinB family protein [Robertkochia marina]
MKTKDLNKSEYAIFYAPYINVVGAVDLLEELVARQKAFNTILNGLEQHDLGYSYAPGKWTIAELILHIIDAERVFQYRALCIARGDMTSFPGYDQDTYVKASEAEKRSLVSLREEFNAVRAASLALFRSFSSSSMLRVGQADGKDVSVRALGFMISGHQKHHELVLKDRYLAK